jgi:hypothetical protein
MKMGSFSKKRDERNGRFEENAMIYTVFWFENKTPQSVFSTRLAMPNIFFKACKAKQTAKEFDLRITRQ